MEFMSDVIDTPVPQRGSLGAFVQGPSLILR
jgi:hypothetical protein